MLEKAARSAAVADQWARHLARRYAAPAVGGLRQHRKPHAGSWKHPAARDGRARSARRGTLAHRQPGTFGKYAARFPGSRPRSSPRRLGHNGIAPCANDWRISDPVSHQSGCIHPRLRHVARCWVRFDLQRAAGGPSGAAGSAGGASLQFQHIAAQPCAQSSHGRGSRTCDGRLDAAALFLESFRSARQTDPRFRPEGVLLAAYDLSGRNPDEASEREFAARLLERLRSLPDVEAAAIATNVPVDLHGIERRSFTVEGRVRTEPGKDRAISNTVTPGYFKVMGIPLVEGNDFTDMRDKAAPAQAIVNEEFVRRYLDGADALGRRLQARAGSFAIVGVARNSVYEAFGEPAQPAVYFSYRDLPDMGGEIHLRTRSGNETALTSEARAVLRDLDPMLPLYDVRTFSQHIERNLYLRRIPARMFVVLGPLLLGLAAIGIYAVVSYAVARRSREFGVRLAFGATSGRVVWQIIGENLGVITCGAAIGWILALVVSVRVIAMTKGAVNLPVFLAVP